MGKVYLSCGHTTYATHSQTHDGLPENHPSCFIHETCRQVAAPDLTGRFAKCTYDTGRPGHGRYYHEGDHTPRPSSPNLAFFEYKGPGSLWAFEHCKNCNSVYAAHVNKKKFANDERQHRNFGKVCDNFISAETPAEFDEFYCGCFGWD